MISIALATALAAPAVPPTPPLKQRQSYASCLTRFTKANLSAKMDAASFKAAARTACAAEEATFKNAMIDYDMKMGAKRAAAEEGIALEIEDYLASNAENYEVQVTPASAPQ